MKQGESRRRSLGVKYQIVIPIALLMALTIGVISVLGYRAGFKALDRTYMNTLVAETRQLTQELEHFYGGQVADAQFLAENDVLVDLVRNGDYESASAFLAGFYRAKSNLESVFISSAELDTTILANGVSDELNGLQLAGTGYDENIHKALAGEGWVSDPRSSRATGLPVILVSQPMFYDGDLVGIVGVSVDIQAFTEKLIASTRIGLTGYPAVTTLDGLIFAHPAQEHILETDLTEFDWGNDLLRAGDGDLIFYDWFGEDMALAVARSAEYRFLTLATIELQEIRAEGMSIARMLAIVGIAGLVVTVAIAMVILFLKLKPITEAVGIADRIALGDFNVDRLKVGTHDEMWSLAEALESMVTSLSYKAGVLETIASGDLSGEIETASDVDSLGQSLVAMKESLNSLLVQVDGAVDQVASGSDQVAQASQSLSQGATEQASALEQITSSLTEINGQSKKNVTYAEQGNDRMKDLVQAMAKINDSSDEIRQVVSVIDDIAFQINLLALNANVEAARAGRYGKGFAVVAEEVRNLAVRSATAVKETTIMVDETVRNIEIGSEFATETARHLEEVAIASREQAQGVDQINSGLEQIDQVTQANTASAEQSAAAAEELAAQARQLKAVISKFKLGSAGRAAGAAESGFAPSADLPGRASVAEATGAATQPATDTPGTEEPAPQLVGSPVARNGSEGVRPRDVIKLDDDDFGDF